MSDSHAKHSMTSPPSEVPEPVFTRRTHSTKRRARRRLAELSPPRRDESPPSARLLPARLPLTRAATRPGQNKSAQGLNRKRRGLLTAPRIPGYEQEASDCPITRETDYSAAALARLRAASAPPAPLQDVPEACQEPSEPSPAPLVAPLSKAALPRASAPLPALPKRPASPVRETSGRPDPFSAAWQNGLTRDAAPVDEDGDVFIVDDYTGIADEDTAQAYIPLEGGDVDMLTAEIKRGEDESDDGEWQTAQLGRAGHLPRLERKLEDVSLLSTERARLVIRQAEEADALKRQARSKAAGRCVSLVTATKEEWEKRYEGEEDKMRRLDEAVMKSKTEIRAVEGEIERRRRRLVFYDRFTASVDDVSDMLREKQKEIQMWHAKRLAQLTREGDRILALLTGQPDEFGRSRDPILALPESTDDQSDDDDGPFTDVQESVSSIEELCRMFRKWKRSYPNDYSAAFGDAGFGRLVGALALGNTGHGLQWMLTLSDEQLRAAVGVAGILEYTALFVRARWRPREGEFEEVEDVYRVLRLSKDTDVESLMQAFQERARAEMGACVVLRDIVAAGRMIRGAAIFAMETEMDVGMSEMLTSLVQIPCNESLPREVLESCELVAQSNGKSIPTEAIKMAKNIIATNASNTG